MNILNGNKIDCKKIYDKMVECIKTDNEWIIRGENKVVCILDSDDFASKKYVELKQKTASECGIKIDVLNLEEYKNLVDKDCHSRIFGILQLPAPKETVEYVDGTAEWILEDLDYLLGVDYAPLIEYNSRDTIYTGLPATVRAVLEILNNIYPDLSGKKIAIVGCRSKTVGSFLPCELLKRNATIALYHSKSEIKPREFETFDVVISCVGKGGIIKQEHFGDKRGCVCIDIGVSRGEDNKVIGDFDKDIREFQYYTPYVNGVGLLTRIFLMYNYIQAVIERIYTPTDSFDNKNFSINNDIFSEEEIISYLSYIISFRHRGDINRMHDYFETIEDKDKRNRIIDGINKRIESIDNETIGADTSLFVS